MELNELRQQMALLKEKIDSQQIVNEQLVRQTVDRKVSTISRVRRVKRIYLFAALFFVPPMMTIFFNNEGRSGYLLKAKARLVSGPTVTTISSPGHSFAVS